MAATLGVPRGQEKLYYLLALDTIMANHYMVAE